MKREKKIKMDAAGKENLEKARMKERRKNEQNIA